jgi:hypothetical protein
MFAFHQANSQVLISLLFGDKLNSEKIEFGLEGGFNFSNMSDFQSTTLLPAFNLGFYFDILLKDQWYLNTGVLVKSSVGLDKLSESDVSILDPQTIFLQSGDYSQKINYFHVPVTIKYRFKNHFFANLGPQVALRTKAQLIFDGEQDNKTVEIKTDNQDLFTRLEMGVVAGVGYKLRKGKGMNIGFRYFQGLTDIIKDDAISSRNKSYYFTVGIPIGRKREDN